MLDTSELHSEIITLLQAMEAKSFADRALSVLLIKHMERIIGEPLLPAILVGLERVLDSPSLKGEEDRDSAALIFAELSNLIEYLAVEQPGYRSVREN